MKFLVTIIALLGFNLLLQGKRLKSLVLGIASPMEPEL